MEKPLIMEPDRDPPPVTNYAPVSPLGWDARDFMMTCSARVFRVRKKPSIHNLIDSFWIWYSSEASPKICAQRRSQKPIGESEIYP